MTWTDKLRNWDYDFTLIIQWFWNIVEFHVQRVGWPAYVAIGFAILAAGLSFPPTRGMTALIISGTFRTMFAYIQIVMSLITVQAVGFIGKLFLAQFHRSRRWIGDLVSRLKGE